MINNLNSKKFDDRIVIKKDLTYNEFAIDYTENNDGVSSTHKLFGLYRSQVLDYVYMVLKNQSLDNEGYKAVQINMLAMPRLLVDGDKFKQVYYRQHFYELVGSGLDMMENCVVVKEPKCEYYTDSFRTPTRSSKVNVVRPQHLYFDDNSM